LNGKQTYRRVVAQAAFGLVCLMALATPALAQVNTNPAIAIWRPKDGLYAHPGKDFDSRCGEYGDIIIGLTEKSVSGHEWDCNVTKRTDTAPDAITLNMTCSDYNLAATLFPRDPKSEEKEFKEVLVLKIDVCSKNVEWEIYGSKLANRLLPRKLAALVHRVESESQNGSRAKGQ
jgi:hypothetical protein